MPRHVQQLREGIATTEPTLSSARAGSICGVNSCLLGSTIIPVIQTYVAFI